MKEMLIVAAILIMANGAHALGNPAPEPEPTPAPAPAPSEEGGEARCGKWKPYCDK